MRLISKGSENYIFDPTPEALAFLKTLVPPSRASVGKNRQFAEEKDGFWRVSSSALASLKVSA